VLNTDAESYGGSGVGNFGAVEAEPQMWHGRPASAALRLPPSGVLWLAPEDDVVDAVGPEQAADIGQAAPVTPGAPVVVGDTAPAAAPAGPAGASPVGSADVPELSSGDGTIAGGVDQAYALDDDAEVETAGSAADEGTPPEHGRSDERSASEAAAPEWVRSATATEAGGDGASGDDGSAGSTADESGSDVPHFPEEAPADAVREQAELLDPARSTGAGPDAPEAASSGDAPSATHSPLGRPDADEGGDSRTLR
jgi:1,4-alpha-glucan branching enzyme